MKTLSDAQWWVEEVMPIQYPSGRPCEATIRRNLGLLKRLRARHPREDILLALREFRRAAEYGELGTFVRAGDDFGLQALQAKTSSIYTFARFLHAARKRQEGRKAKPLKSLQTIMAQIAKDGMIG